MADANANEADVATMRVPVLILNASVTALVGFALALVAIMLDASLEFIVTTAVLAVVGGCGVLAALVAHNTRKTIAESQRVIIDAMNLRMDQIEADTCDVKAALVKQGECSVKTAKAVRGIVTGLADCKTRITEEVEKVRVAQYALHAESTGSPARRPNLGVVEN